ncbi:MAG: hypothetical protein ABI758_06705 [Candidatus Woesebacteria bacterium]
MEKIIKTFINSALNQKIWNSRHKLGSMIAFEVGKEIEEGRGEYHFWLENCHWWLQQGTGKDFEDIVNSESSQDAIASKIKILDGKKPLNVQFKTDNSSTIFDFEDNLFLKIAPYKGETIVEQWYAFTPQVILTVKSDGTAKVKNA